MDNSTLIKQLAAIVDGHLYVQKAELASLVFSPLHKCGLLPLAAAEPSYAAQILALLDFCRTHCIQIRVRGGGSAWLRRDWPKNGPWLLLMTSRLNRILEIDRTNRVARVQAGVLCHELGHAVAEAGLRLPLEPRAKNGATIGGAIAANMAGVITAKYGSLGNYVEALKLFSSGFGEIQCHAQKGLPGNVAGGLAYASLPCGSCGTLGMIGEITLRLPSLPPEREIRIIQFDDELAAAEIAKDLSCQAVIPAALAFLDREAAGLLNLAPLPAILLEFDGNSMEIATGFEICDKIIAGCGAYAAPRGAIDSIWEKYAVLNMAAMRGNAKFESVSCPPARFPAMLEACRTLAATHNVELIAFGAPAVSTLSLVLRDSECASVDALAKDIFTLELTLNNALACEDDMNLTREQWRGNIRNHAQISRAMRRVFDPYAIFSPDDAEETQ